MNVRDTQGRYQPRLDRVCVCGHTLSQHTADRYVSGSYTEQPCCEDCACRVFTRAKESR